jgi:hypothetical protein
MIGFSRQNLKLVAPVGRSLSRRQTRKPFGAPPIVQQAEASWFSLTPTSHSAAAQASRPTASKSFSKLAIRFLLPTVLHTRTVPKVRSIDNENGGLNGFHKSA